MSLPCLPPLKGQPEEFIGWSCGLMDKALVLGTKDCRLESCQDQDQTELGVWRTCVEDGDGHRSRTTQMLKARLPVPRAACH